MKKNYNNSRPKLHLPEYGRHIQQMVETLLLIEDRAERNKQARAVIAVMGNVNPLLRDTPVFTHKLWDHLFIISDFKLDVDSPYEQPSRDDLSVKPRPLSYPQCRIRHKHYGKYVDRIVKRLSEESGEVVASTVHDIAVFMRAKSFEFNQEHPNNEAILKDIKLMSEGTIQVNEDDINNIRSDYKQHLSAHAHKPHQRRNNGHRDFKSRTISNNNGRNTQGNRTSQTSRPHHQNTTTRHNVSK